MSAARPASIFHWLLAGALAFLVGAIAFALWDARSQINPDDPEQVAEGARLYDMQCSACHGVNLEGQPGWRKPLPNGRMPAPPHDASGHTWHHPDAILFGITKEGMVPGKYAPPGYESDMPAFGGVLTDAEIRAVLTYIKSTWPERERAFQMDIERKSREIR